MIYKSERELTRDLSAGLLHKAYLFYGKENYLKSAYLGRILKATFPNGESAFDLVRLDGKKLSPQQLFDATEPMPLTGAKRCVVVDDFDTGQLSDSEVKEICGVMEDLPPSTVLIMVTRTADLDTKKAAGKKLLASVDKAGGAMELKGRTGNELTSFVVTRAQKAGCEMSNDNARLLIERCSDDMDILAGEVDKLTAYQGKGEITEESIKKVSCAVVEGDVYALSKLLLQGNMNGAMKAVDALFTMRHPASAMIASLCYAFIDLYRADAGRRAGKTAGEIASDFSYRFEFRVTNAMRDSRSINRARIGRAIEILTQSDIDLKSAKVEERVLVETAIMRVYLALKGENALC